MAPVVDRGGVGFIGRSITLRSHDEKATIRLLGPSVSEEALLCSTIRYARSTGRERVCVTREGWGVGVLEAGPNARLKLANADEQRREVHCGAMSAEKKKDAEHLKFSVDILELEDVHFYRLTHTLKISVNVSEDYLKVVALDEFLKTATLVASVSDACELIDLHLAARERRGFVEEENKYVGLLPPKYEWMQHLHLILDYERSEVDRRRKVLKFKDPPRKVRVNLIRQTAADVDDGAGRGKVLSRTVVAAEPPEPEKLFPTVQAVLDHHGEIDVTFGEGALGLRLRNRRHHRKGTMIGAFVSNDEGKPGPGEECGALKPFMRVVSINGEDATELDFEHAIDLIRASVRPITIRFAPPVESDLPVDTLEEVRQLVMEAAHREDLEAEYEEDPGNLHVARSLGYALYADGVFHTAVDLLRKVRSDPHDTLKNGRYWIMLGRSIVKLWQKNRLGRKDLMGEAKDAYEQALTFEENATSPIVWHEMADVYLNYGSLAGASKLYAQIIDDFPNYRRLNEVIWKAGSVLRYLELHNDATQYMLCALDSPPPGVPREDIALELGKCFSRQGQRDHARKAYQQAYTWAKAGPGDVRPGTPNAGDESFASWVRSVTTWTDAGQRHQKNGNLLLAIDCYRQAIAFSGESDEHVWWLLANAFYEIRSLDDAINCCTNILALNPYNQQAVRAKHSWEMEMEISTYHIDDASGYGSGDEDDSAIDGQKDQDAEEEQKAATSVQCLYRRRQARKEVQKKRAERNRARKEQEEKQRNSPENIRAQKKLNKLKKRQSMARIQNLKKQQEELLASQKSRKNSWGSSASGQISPSTTADGDMPVSPHHDPLAHWGAKLEGSLTLFKSTLEMQSAVQSVIKEADVHADEAFCALVDVGGDVRRACEALKDVAYFHSLRAVCNAYDVRKYALKQKGTHRKPTTDSLRIDEATLSASRPQASVPQWTPDRRVLQKSALLQMDNLSPYEHRVLEQDFSNRRLMSGTTMRGLPSKDSIAMDKKIEYYMTNFEMRHIREWTRARQMEEIRKLQKGTHSRSNPFLSPMRKSSGKKKLSPLRRKAVKATILSPMGHDGTIPVLKTAHWSKTKEIELKRKGRRMEKIKQMGQSPVKKKIPSTCTAPEIEKYFRRSVAL